MREWEEGRQENGEGKGERTSKNIYRVRYGYRIFYS